MMARSSHSGQTRFNGSPHPTIGVEAELFLVDPASYDLVDAAPAILSRFSGDPHVKAELLESMIEVNTGICEDVSAVKADLKAKIGAVAKVAAEQHLGLVSMGTHPFGRWSDASVTGNDRYQGFLERMQFPVRRLLISGLHVHIGVPDGERAIAVMNGLLRYIPHFIGLSANSPFWDGERTGLASTRMKVFEGMPTGGLPPRLTDYNQFRQLARTLMAAGAINSVSEIWWDIRPHPGFGTVEIRLMDAVPSIGEMVSLAALAQCLVVALLDDYETAQLLPLLPEWVVRENKWRGVRYGLGAEIIIDDEGARQPLKDALAELLARLEPVADRLGCGAELALLHEVATTGAPGDRQVSRHRAGGDLKAVVGAAMLELNRL